MKTVVFRFKTVSWNSQILALNGIAQQLVYYHIFVCQGVEQEDAGYRGALVDETVRTSSDWLPTLLYEAGIQSRSTHARSVITTLLSAELQIQNSSHYVRDMCGMYHSLLIISGIKTTKDYFHAMLKSKEGPVYFLSRWVQYHISMSGWFRLSDLCWRCC